jgi:hypothetical protein
MSGEILTGAIRNSRGVLHGKSLPWACGVPRGTILHGVNEQQEVTFTFDGI